MAIAKSGTNVAAPITTFTDADTYATAYANEIQGGRHSVDTLVNRNAIPKARRKEGMVCYVKATNLPYKLKNNPTTDTTQDSDWEKDIPSANDIEFADGDTLAEKVSDLEAVAADRYAQFTLLPVNVGISEIEHMMRFNAKVVSIAANVPMETALTKDIVINLEKYTGIWSTVDSVTIISSDPAKSGIKNLTTPQDIITGDRLRLNIVSAQAGIESLVIAVGLQLTK
jgi:hypothetical protein